MHPIDDCYNFARIDDRLTTSGVVGAERLAALAEQGYACVIDLLPADSEYALANERELVEGQGLAYVHIPVDFAAPGADDFRRFEQALDAGLETEGRVHVHCAANFRVSAFYALYAESKGLWDRAAADAHIEAIWEPRDWSGWPEFLAAVRAGFSVSP